MYRWTVIVLAMAGAGAAQALTGTELYHYCQTEACGGYFVGAFDGVRIAAAVGGASKSNSAALAICPPDDVTDEQVVDVALRYLDSHPQLRYLQAANLGLRAWAEVWPCAR